jgi:predicted aspartyl protease
MELVGRLAAALAAAACLAWAAPAASECFTGDQLVAAPSPLLLTDGASGPTSRDRRGRMVAPVSINGSGPYRFIVDTGANRSVISQALAQSLGLTPIGTGEVHSVHEVTTAPLVNAGSLVYGGLPMPGEQVPLLDGSVLAGEQGLLGVDGMRGRRLRLDFERKCIEILPASTAPRLRNWSTIQGQLRFGHLVLIPGRIRGQPVNLFIDTGSDISMANVALREQLRVRLDNSRTEIARAFTAGTPIVLDSAVFIPRLTMGEVEVTNLVAFVGNFHIFDLWGLRDEPTLLIGMDVLSQARAIAIDYEHATVHFRLTRFQTGTRLRPPGFER